MTFIMVGSCKRSAYPCKIIPNTVIEWAEQLSTDNQAFLFFFFFFLFPCSRIEAELSESTGIIRQGLIPIQSGCFPSPLPCCKNYVELVLLFVVWRVYRQPSSLPASGLSMECSGESLERGQSLRHCTHCVSPSRSRWELRMATATEENPESV